MDEQSPKPTCKFIKDNRERCKRSVAEGEDKCLQHAGSIAHSFKALTRNQTIAFVGLLLGLVLTIGVFS
jgi:hypothetical protein